MMKTFFSTRFVALSFALIFTGSPSAALHAQATKIFVASTGNDANDGGRGTPKRNFQAAHNAVTAGGQIVVLDTAGYGALTITKSLTVTVPPGVNGFVTVSGSASGITVNAGSSGSVSLRGLIVEGNLGTGYGLSVNTVGNLSIEDCTIRSFTGGIVCNNSTPANFFLYNTTVRGCATGISFQSTAAVATAATINGCKIEQNSSIGLLAVPASGSTADVSMADCVVAGNLSGIEADTRAVVRVSNCSITDNTTGVTSNGGQVLSRANNTLEKNTSGNSFGATYSAK